jgi:hypothetical protein
MKYKFLSQFDTDNLGKTVTCYVIAISLVAVSLLVDMTDNFLNIMMLLGGIALFLYILLRPWGKASYYAIMCGISLIILTTEFLAPHEFWLKQLKGLAEIIGLTAGFIFLQELLQELLACSVLGNMINCKVFSS